MVCVVGKKGRPARLGHSGREARRVLMTKVEMKFGDLEGRSTESTADSKSPRPILIIWVVILFFSASWLLFVRLWKNNRTALRVGSGGL